MLGITGKPESKDGSSLEPMNSYHLQAMSIGFLIEEETPMIWRGPMVTQALEQLLRDTNWRDLDYLIVDLPPEEDSELCLPAQAAGLTLAEIGDILGVTESRVSQIHTKSVIHLRSRMAASGIG